MKHQGTNKTSVETAKTFSSAGMKTKSADIKETIEAQELEQFALGVLDLKLLIDDFGAERVVKHLKECYPVEYSQLAGCFNTQHKQISALLKRKT